MSTGKKGIEYLTGDDEYNLKENDAKQDVKLREFPPRKCSHFDKTNNHFYE